MKPLYRALTGSPRPKTLDWIQELNKAFEEAKNALSQATLLHHPVAGARIALTTDASDIAIGAVLEQQVHGQWQPLAFYSRQLNKMEIVMYYRPLVTRCSLSNPALSAFFKRPRIYCTHRSQSNCLSYEKEDLTQL